MWIQFLANNLKLLKLFQQLSCHFKDNDAWNL